MDFKIEFIVIYAGNILALILLILISEYVLNQYKGQNQDIQTQERLLRNEDI